MGIKITSKVPGFRRAGLAHEGTVVYPRSRFTAAQVAALRAEKNLVVEDVEDPKVEAPKVDTAPDGEGKTGDEDKKEKEDKAKK